MKIPVQQTRSRFENIMLYVHQILFFILISTSFTNGYCPREKIHSTGQCAFRIQCTGNIRGVSLPEDCQGSTNYPVNVDLTLTNAIERFDDHIDADFLASIITFRVSGKWPSTKLSILQYTPRLQNLYLIDNHMERLTDAPFFYLSRLEILDLSHNELTDIEELFQFETHPNKLSKLSLAFNNIDEIPGDAFEELTSLVELDLSHNFISDLNEEPFFNLTNLEILKLNNNKIKDLNGAVNNLQNLKHLYLRGNQIQNIDAESLKIIIHLETFDVSWNQLEKIKPIMFSRHWKHFGSHSVCKIILSENHISFVPNGTAKEISSRFARHLRTNAVDVLTELDLSKNEITTIEYNAFQSLLRLISLDLSRNKIIDFIVNADDLTYVKYLNLSSNYITRLYFESFSTMTNLQNLDLSYNTLDNIPDQTFTNNYNLKHVNMTFNEIEKLDNLHISMFHPDGGVLDLSNNGLKQLRIPFGEGLRLTMLLLSSNNISDPSLIGLSYQSDLKHLDMSKNFILGLDGTSFRFPPGLVYLDLSCNQIERIRPSTFHRLGHLKTLRLARNDLTTIEYGSFQGLTTLLNLDLSYNKIRYMDAKLLMDLKILSVLSLRFNGLHILDYKGWLSHRIELKVYLEGNNLTCGWLATALSDFNNGYSKMRPAVLMETMAGHSLEGIPCIQEDKEMEQLVNSDSMSVMTDERLLVTSQKILEAIKGQTYYLRKYMWRSVLDESEKAKAFA